MGERRGQLSMDNDDTGFRPSITPGVGPESSPDGGSPKASRAGALIVALTVAAIVGLSLWYLVQPQPLLVQGEVDATRIDIAARVDGRVAERPVNRGDNVTAGQLLVSIDNPELLVLMGWTRRLLDPQQIDPVP